MEDEEVQAVGGSSSWPVQGEGESTLLTLMEEASSEGRAEQAEEYKNQLLQMINARKYLLEGKEQRSMPKLPVTKTIPPAPTPEQLAEIAFTEYKEKFGKGGEKPKSDFLWGQSISELISRKLSYQEPETTEEWVQKAMEYKAKQSLPPEETKPFVRPTLERAQELLKSQEKQGKAAKYLAADALIGEFKEEDIDAYLKERPILDARAVIPPGDDYNIPIGDGKTQYSPTESAGAFVNFSKLAKQLTGEEVNAMGANGAHRSLQSNIDRVLASPKANLRYFMNKAGPYTQDNMHQEGKFSIKSLGRSPHITGPDGEPIAIDVAINAGAEADKLEAIEEGRGYKPGQPDDIDPKTGKVKLYPSNEALRNTEIGKFMYWNKSYYLLINGLIPVGDDNDYKTGKQITEPNTGRPEGWHIELDRPEATRRLIEFGMMDENGVLMPPASPWGAGTSLSGKEFLTEESQKDIEDVTTTWTPEERQNQLLKEAQADYDSGRAAGLKRGPAIDRLVTTRSKGTALALKAIKGTFNEKTGQYEGGYEQAALKAQKERDESAVLAAKAKETLVKAKTEIALSDQALKGIVETEYRNIEQDEEREYKRLLDGVQDKSKAIKENIPNAWRQFQFIEEVKDKDGKPVIDPKTGKTEWEWNGFKTGYTIAAALALIANAALTISSAMKKKGKTVPFLAWDMISEAIRIDLDGQRRALEGHKAALNADLSAMGAWDKYFGNKRAAVAQMEIEYGDYIDAELKKAELQYGKDGLVDAQNTVREVATLNAENTAKIKVDLARILAEEIREQTTADIGTKMGQQAEENKKLFALINAYAVSVKKAPEEKKLNRDQQQYVDSAASFLSTAQEMKDLWMRSGGDENFLWKFIADIDNLDVFHLSEAHEDLVKLKILRNTWAASLARMQGNRGALTEVEQDRGMLMIPRKDTSKIGQWKMRRAYARAKLMATEAWYFLDAAAKNNLMRQITQLKDNEAGLAQQVKILDHLGERFGGKTKKKTAEELQATFKVKGAKDTAKEQEEAAAPVQKGAAPGKKIE